MQDRTDHLVRHAQSGDHDAFSELMTSHRQLVRRTAYRILKNSDDAEDVLQDASLIVFRKLHTFEGQSAFSTWLTRIVINLSLVYLRKASRSRVTYLDELAGGEGARAFELSDTAPCPEEQYLANEFHDRLLKGISNLPSALRDVLSDQIYLDMPMAEVARRRGLSIAAAKSRTYRARKLLSQKLAGHCVNPRSAA